MSVLIEMKWAGATKEQYDQLREVVQWDIDPAPGGLFHVAAFDETGAHISDVWESAEQFQAFVDARLMPAVATVGIEGAPTVEIRQVHATYTPPGSMIDLTAGQQVRA